MKSLIVSLLLSAQYGAALDYNYDDNGDNWTTANDPAAKAGNNKACENGKRQSPINLKTDLTPKETGEFFKHYENVDYQNANEAVQTAGYGKTTFKASGGAQALYLNLDMNSALTGKPTIDPASPTWFATPNYFVSSDAKTYGGDE